MEATVRFRGGNLRFTPAGLTLTRPRGGWAVGPAQLRFIAVRRVQFGLWYLLGGLLTAYCLIGIVGDSLNPLPAWGGLLGGGLLIVIGRKGAWQLAVHQHDTPDALTVWLYGVDDGALRRFEDLVNDYLRTAAEARRLAALAELVSAPETVRLAPATPRPNTETAPGATSAAGGATFVLLPPAPPNPYPPSLLPGILP